MREIGHSEKKKPLVSVIVPVYNAEKYLETCVRSILFQTYRHFELILINDGSTDGSLDLCHRFADKDERIKVYSQPNGGASAARNKGLDVAKGEYIIFVDSDDYISETFIENMFLAAEFGPYDIVQCQSKCTVDAEPKIFPVFFQESDVREITKEQALNDRLYKVSVWGKFYSKRILEGFRFREGIIYEDDASYYLFVDRAEKIALIDETLYYYYLSDNSVMRNANKDKSTVFTEIYEERIRYFSVQENQILLDGSYSRFCLVLMLYISSGLVKGYNKKDIPRFVALFKQYYPKVMASGHVSWKDKVMFTCFNISPQFVGRIIGMLGK